jgi:hypothetical protein
VNDNRKMEIYLAVTNNFKKGDNDEYVKVAEVPVKQQKFPITFQSSSTFFKILVKTPNQALNTWIGK